MTMDERDMAIQYLESRGFAAQKQGDWIICGTGTTQMNLYGEEITVLHSAFFIRVYDNIWVAEFDYGQAAALAIKVSDSPIVTAEGACNFVSMKSKFTSENEKEIYLHDLFGNLRLNGWHPEVISETELHLHEIEPPPLPYQSMPYEQMLMDINANPKKMYISMSYNEGIGWRVIMNKGNEQERYIADTITITEGAELIISQYSRRI